MRLPSFWARFVAEVRTSPSTIHKFVRWWIAGTASTAIGMPLLYLLVSILRIRVPVATLLGGELGLLLRYVVNDRWVFRESGQSWRRLWQFHAAAAGSFVVWWTITNILAGVGVHYLVAAVGGTLGSVGCSVATNFLWVWRRTGEPRKDALAEDTRYGGS